MKKMFIIAGALVLYVLAIIFVPIVGKACYKKNSKYDSFIYVEEINENTMELLNKYSYGTVRVYTKYDVNNKEMYEKYDSLRIEIFCVINDSRDFDLFFDDKTIDGVLITNVIENDSINELVTTIKQKSEFEINLATNDYSKIKMFSKDVKEFMIDRNYIEEISNNNPKEKINILYNTTLEKINVVNNTFHKDQKNYEVKYGCLYYICEE